MTSDTHVTAETLRTLHRIHRQLTDLKARLSRGPQVVRARRANVERLEAELARREAEVQSLASATNEKQGQLAAKEANMEKRRRQLREASDNREYQAIRDEIAASKAANEVLEVEILEAMETLDAMNARVDAARHNAAKAREDAEKVAQQVAESEPVIRADIERLGQELQQHEADLPGEFRDLYHRSVRQRGEDALATIQGEFCEGCHQHVPVNMINDLMLNRPVSCKSCGRLLYLPEDYSAR
jgi:hypothetical protein